MKKIFYIFIFIISLFLFQGVFAEDENIHSIKYYEALKVSDQMEKNGNIYFTVSAKIQRLSDESFDVYMLLDKIKKSDGSISTHILCSLKKEDVSKSVTPINFDPTETNSVCDTKLSLTADFFNDNYSYRTYISDSPSGGDIAIPKLSVDFPGVVAVGSGQNGNDDAVNDDSSNNNAQNQDSQQQSEDDGGSVYQAYEGSGFDGKALVSTECGYSKDGDGNFRMCDFNDGMNLLNRVIDYIFALVLPIAAIIFAYVGFLFISSAAKPDKRTAAKAAMGKLVLGIVVIMIAWILIKTILVALGVGDGFNFMGIRN